MLDSDTRRRIDTCRDILVGKVPDPKSQVEQITIALIYKFMDDMDAEAEAMGGKRSFFTGEFEKYAWPRLMAPDMGGFDTLSLYTEAIQKMNENPGVPPLFRDIFKNAYLPYRDPETLRSFIKEINGFTYDHSERLGDAFEYLLSVLGSQGDAGQFRTPRHIIDFMVEITDPRKDETILDPACGTAGFLISAYKHILKNNTKDYKAQQELEAYEEQGVSMEALTLDNPLHYRGDLLTPDDRKRLAGNIHGYDISPDMVRLSLVNMYLHGFTDPHIEEYDTLTSDEKWNELGDVILANPPFMSPKGGIKPHKRFSVQSKRSEVLFVDYIAEHLTPNGRAAVVVPEGIIFQSQTAYKQLREMLVKHYLMAVISLPAGIFNPYSGVKTSILVMDRRMVKKTGDILFIKIENDGFNLGAQRRPIDKNDLPDAVKAVKAFRLAIESGKPEDFDVDDYKNLQAVSRERIGENGEWNLSWERYKETAAIDSQYDLVKLGTVCELVGGGTPSKSKADYWDNGTVKWISSKHIDDYGYVTGYELITDTAVTETSTKIAPRGSVILITRVSVGKFAFADDDYAINQDLTALVPKDENVLSSSFLFRIADKIAQIVEKNAQGIGVRGVTRKFLSDLEIPLPPLDLQKEIVAEIEGYQKIINGARQVVENYQPRIPIDPDWPMVELSKVIKLSSGQFLSGVMQEGGPFPVYGGNGVNGYHKEYLLEEPTIVIGRVGAYCGAVHITTPKSWVTDNGLYVKEFLGINNLKFIALSLIELNLNQFAKVGGQPSISQLTILERRIALPNLDIQDSIVSEIEAEQHLVDLNKDLVSRFEDKMRQAISRVWGGAGNEGLEGDSDETVIKVRDISDGLSPDLMEVLTEQGVWGEMPVRRERAHQGDVTVSQMMFYDSLSVINATDLSDAKVTVINLKKLLGIRPTASMTLAVSGEVYALANENSNLGMGLLATGVLLAAIGKAKDYVKEMLNNQHAAMLMALKEFQCPQAVDKQQLYYKTNALLENAGEPEISETKLEKILNRFHSEIKCLKVEPGDKICLKNKVTYK